jgi:3' terminal RNA ribose 2'-O-methyltransferase Hen1
MLLTISTTHRPATDLGFLLHKNPARAHGKALPFGAAHLVYPEATDERCTAALVVEVDPVDLVRNRAGGPKGQAGTLAQYVNDRPYAASSFLSVAIGQLLGSALGGRSRERPELADTPIPLVAGLPTVPARGGEDLLRRLFEPLGYTVEARTIPLDPTFPEWGDSRYLAVTLTGTVRVRDLLEHLFVLLPVLDDDKHYWVGADEVDKLLRRAGDWLAGHPERTLITRRYLRHDRRLTTEALARLLAADDTTDSDSDADEATDADGTAERGGPDREPAGGVTARDAAEAAVERPLSLNERRLRAVVEQVNAAGARSVVDLGCGGGNLVRRLLRDTRAERILGIDVSHRALEAAARRLHLDTMPPRQRQRLELAQGALTYRDRRTEGFDAACVVEVIEHLGPGRLQAFERVLFAHARPATVIVTTPNVEYNARFPTLPAGGLRHADHRFEWTRAEFAAWATSVAATYGYAVAHHGIGDDDPALGPPTQMAVFSR